MAKILPAFMAIAAVSGMLYRQDAAGDTGGTGTAAAPVAPPAPSANVAMQPVTFHFKTDKIRDEKGTVIGEGKKLPSANLFLPVPTKEYLIQVLQGGEEYKKEQDLLMGGVLDVIYGVARGQINAFREVDANKESLVTQEVLDLSKLDWTAIANMPARERASSIPSDEDQQAFFDAYLEVMPAALDKPKEKIENHINIFKSGFKKHRAQKDFLEVFQSALGVFANTVPTEVLEEHLPVVEFFTNRIERFLKAEEKITMDDI